MTIQCDLSGKLALITGASSGLGKHFAEVLANHGAEVVLAARRRTKLEEVRDQISDKGGIAHVVEMDVTSIESVDAAFSSIKSKTGRACNIIVNNSGIGQESWFLNTQETEWSGIVETNLSGVWRVAQRASNEMVEAKTSGSIINIASITGLRPAPMVSGYAATKAAVVHLTKNMATELARYQIRVNAISPGYFKTPLNDQHLESEFGQKMEKRIAMRRFGNYVDLDGPILLLASDASAYMTGCNIVVDGGHTLTPL